MEVHNLCEFNITLEIENEEKELIEQEIPKFGKWILSNDIWKENEDIFITIINNKTNQQKKEKINRKKIKTFCIFESHFS
jgi:hypothetical protein